MLQFKESGHPAFTWHESGGGKRSIHELGTSICGVAFEGIYGAVAKWRNEVRHRQPSLKLKSKLSVKYHQILEHVFRDTNLANLARGELPAAVQLTHVCEDAGFSRTVTEGQLFMTTSAIELTGQAPYVRLANTLILVTTPSSKNNIRECQRAAHNPP